MPDERAPLGEFAWIRRLTSRLPRGAGVIVGPGDDAAVVRPADGMDLAITTDAFIEERHYRRSWAREPAAVTALANAVGRRLAAAGLSDLAAMAALPRWAVLSIGTNGRDPAWLEALEHALAQKLDQAGAALVGGNLGRVSGPEWFDLTLVGEVERGRAWTRRGARAGDLVAVTGAPGRAAAFLAIAEAHFSGRKEEESGALAAAWCDPPLRVAAARALAAAGGVTAAIDLSDGLTSDLSWLCEASGIGAELDEAALAGGATAAPETCFGPSDDYELLLAIDPAKREACEQAARGAGAPLTFIGRATATRGELTLHRSNGSREPLAPRGYDHFDQR